MEEDGMRELYNILKEHKSIKGMDDILLDINTVQDMIDNKFYNKDMVIELESRYSIEIEFFVNLERENNIIFDNNYKDAELQVLVNLRYRLYKIGAYKILKEKGIEIPKEFLVADYNDVIKLINR